MEKLEIHFSILYVKYFLTSYFIAFTTMHNTTTFVVQLKGKFVVHTSETLVMMSEIPEICHLL